MIIWINGPFGAGKTTLAERLAKEVPSAMIYDPETLGILIHRVLPSSRQNDFQDFAFWRIMTPRLVRFLHKWPRRNLIVPMTLVNPDYIQEILGDLKKKEPNFFHLYLDIDRATLEDRINNHDKNIRQWRLDQMARCLAAKSAMPTGTIFLDSGRNNPETLVQMILTATFYCRA